MKLEKMSTLVRKALDDYNMIEDGDKIAVGLSGGKDSVAMLMILKHIMRFYPKKFEVVAITIDLGFQDGFDTTILNDFCQRLDIPYYVVKTEISDIVFEKSENISHCYLCAKLRKGALNDRAIELGCNKIAYAHHKDDAIETFMMSMMLEGRINCFDPVTHLERSGLTLIRPMIYCEEKNIIGFRYRYDIPVIKNPCPNDGVSKRKYIRNYLEQLYKDDPECKKRLFHSIMDGHMKPWIPIKERD